MISRSPPRGGPRQPTVGYARTHCGMASTASCDVPHPATLENDVVLVSRPSTSMNPNRSGGHLRVGQWQAGWRRSPLAKTIRCVRLGRGAGSAKELWLSSWPERDERTGTVRPASRASRASEGIDEDCEASMAASSRLASLLDHLCGGACRIRTLNRVLPLDASWGILAWESR